MPLLKIEDIAKIICKRQKTKESDTFIVIYGLPRTGKTTLGFWILLFFLKLKIEQAKLGLSQWTPETSWIELFKRYFATSSEDMNKKIKYNPPESFEFVDEGLDVISWHNALTKEQKKLLELIEKTGKRRNLVILISPSLKLLTKAILGRAHYMFIIVDEPSKYGNYAFVLKNYKIPLMAENHPFGLDKIFEDLEKFPKIAGSKKLFLRYMMNKNRMIGIVKFRNIDKKLYELYDKIVKEPSIMSDHITKEGRYETRFLRTDYVLSVLIYNLYKKLRWSIYDIEKQFYDKFDNKTASKDFAKTRIDKIEGMLASADYIMDKEEEKKEEAKPEKIEEDIEVLPSLPQTKPLEKALAKD